MQGFIFRRRWEPDLFTTADVAGVRELVAMLTPKPRAVPDFAAEAVLRKLQRNAWVVQPKHGVDDEWEGFAGFSVYTVCSSRC